MEILNNLTLAKFIALSGLIFIFLSFLKSLKSKKLLGKKEFWKIKKYFQKIRKLSNKQRDQFLLRSIFVAAGFYLILKEMVPVVGGFFVLMSCIIHYFQNRVPNIIVFGSSEGKSFSLHRKITDSVKNLRAISLINSDNVFQQKLNEPDCFRTSEDVNWQIVAFGLMEYIPILIVDLRQETKHVQSEIYRTFKHDLLFKTIFVGSDSQMSEFMNQSLPSVRYEDIVRVNSDEECIGLLQNIVNKNKISFNINDTIASFVTNKKHLVRVGRTIFLDNFTLNNSNRKLPLAHDLIKSFIIPPDFNLKLEQELIDSESIFALHNKYNNHFDIELSENYDNPYGSIDKVIGWVRTWASKNQINIIFEEKTKIGRDFPAYMIIYKRKSSSLNFIKVTFIISNREFLFQTAAKDLDEGKRIVNLILFHLNFR
jgi:hypothetical protein